MKSLQCQGTVSSAGILPFQQHTRLVGVEKQEIWCWLQVAALEGRQPIICSSGIPHAASQGFDRLVGCGGGIRTKGMAWEGREMRMTTHKKKKKSTAYKTKGAIMKLQFVTQQREGDDLHIQFDSSLAEC